MPLSAAEEAAPEPAPRPPRPPVPVNASILAISLSQSLGATVKGKEKNSILKDVASD